jgi:branched-chain amino acid transport system permease protein
MSPLGGVVIFVVLAAASSLVIDDQKIFLLTNIAVYALFALTSGVLMGWGGVVSFGQAGLFGIGAYTTALLSGDIPTIPLLVVAACVSAAAALVIGIVGLSSTGVAFALITLAFAQVAYTAALDIPGLGGEGGVAGVLRGTLGPLDLETDRGYWWFVLVVTMICMLFLAKLRDSTYGLGIRAIRDDPRRASAFGAPVRLMRLELFVLNGFLCGICGALNALLTGLSDPSNLYWTLSGNILMMAVLGGISTFWGPILGGGLFTYLSQDLLAHSSSPNLVLGLILLVSVVVLPGGLVSARGKVVRFVERIGGGH